MWSCYDRDYYFGKDADYSEISWVDAFTRINSLLINWLNNLEENRQARRFTIIIYNDNFTRLSRKFWKSVESTSMNYKLIWKRYNSVFKIQLVVVNDLLQVFGGRQIKTVYAAEFQFRSILLYYFWMMSWWARLSLVGIWLFYSRVFYNVGICYACCRYSSAFEERPLGTN